MIWTHLAGNSLIRSFVHRSFAHFAQIKWATVSELLRSLKTNEWPWANGSGHSEEMSDREQITQVAQVKCVTMSDSLRSLRGNERMSHLLKEFWLKNLKSRFNMFYICTIKFFFFLICESLIFAHFLFLSEWCEWIAHFAQIKWEMWANRSGPSLEMSDCERIAQVAHQQWANEWIAHFFEQIFGQKKSDLLGNQMSEFPALQKSDCEQFAQVTHENEQIARFFWVNCSFALLFTKIKQFTQFFFLLKSYFMVRFLYIFLNKWAICSFPLL